jgi:hypothetical protein
MTYHSGDLLKGDGLVKNRCWLTCEPQGISVVIALVLVLTGTGAGLCQESDAGCAEIRLRWEQITQELRDKINTFTVIQQTPVERLIQRPLVTRSEGKTLARQVSEALQAKEELLNAHRKECRTLLTQENELYSQAQDCTGGRKGTKEKDGKSLLKNRQAFIDKAIITLSEVKEVEGRETVLPYSEASGEPDPYRRSVNNYWQGYQQMYRRWWNQ